MMEAVALAIAGVIVLVLFGIAVKSRRRTGSANRRPILLPGTTIRAVPLLTDTDVVFYNLIRLAVQDHYLVLSQVPLWSFVSVEAMGEARRHVLGQMALKRVDFVLVHPGSRLVEQAIHILEASSPRPRQSDRQRVIEAVLDAAGIKLVKMRAEQAYSAPELAALLGLPAED